jgi:acyl-CoA thioesterase-1
MNSITGLRLHHLWQRSWFALAAAAVWVVLGPVAARADGAPRVVFLGDSLTAGYGLAQSEAFPAQLATLAHADGVPIVAVNAGMSGDTSAGALRRLRWVTNSQPAVVVVAIGANDGLRGLPVHELERNLAEILRTLTGLEPRPTIVLAGIKIPTNFGARYREQFEAVFPAVAKRFNVPFIPFLLEGVAANPNYNLPDKLHPNARGHAVIARHVWKTLKPLLMQQPALDSPSAVFP